MARLTFAPEPPRTVVSDALRREIAEELLVGTPTTTIAAGLAAMGVAPDICRAEIEKALASPYLQAAERLKARLAKRDWLLANSARLERLRGHGGEVPRFHQLAADRFFEDFYCANRPVIVTGLVDHWPARRCWSFAALTAELGDVDVDVQMRRDSNPAYEIEADAHSERQNFGRIVERIETGGPTNDFYVTAFNSGRNNIALAPLWDDIGTISGWLAPRDERDGFFWMGPQGTITPFHHDLTNNLMVQIIGSKRVKLVAAAETPRMHNLRHCFSAWTGSDLPSGPGDAERPPVTEVILNPGDALFLPIGWWHHVEGLTPTVGLSFTNFARNNDFYSHYSSYGEL